VKIKANAKVNLSLMILGKREDGYHSIDTVMHSINLFDEIEIQKSNEVSVICDSIDIPQEKNIAYKAAKLFLKDYGISGGAVIKIKKGIPAVAGLGGGSVDAAATLLGLNKIYKANISPQQLCKTAVKLGADVPFFINGGCQRCEGIGEVLTPLSPLKSGCLLLAKAETKPSTAEMYRVLDSKEPIFCDTNAVITAIENNDLLKLSKTIVNSFGAIWQDSFVKQELSLFEPLAVSLSGSGPTWFALFENKDKALKAKKVLDAKKIESYVCDFKDTSIEFE